MVLLMSLAFFSCGKIDLQEEGASGGGGKQPGGGQGPEMVTDSCLTVSQLAEVPNKTEVVVGGYIVGFIPKTSISKTVFGADDAVQTNIVIADSPDETDYHKCAPAQLLADSDARECLNLVDNPDLLGTYVYLYGIKDKYYYAPGLKPVLVYEIADPGDDGEGDKPDTTPEVYPILSKDAPRVIEGN